MAPQDGQQTSFAHSRFLPARDQLGKLGTVVKDPLKSALELGELFEQARLKGSDGEEWDQTDHRAQLERDSRAVFKMQYIIKEFVFVIPERNSLTRNIVHRLRDVQKMFKELECDIFIGGIFCGKLK